MPLMGADATSAAPPESSRRFNLCARFCCYFTLAIAASGTASAVSTRTDALNNNLNKELIDSLKLAARVVTPKHELERRRLEKTTTFSRAEHEDVWRKYGMPFGYPLTTRCEYKDKAKKKKPHCFLAQEEIDIRYLLGRYNNDLSGMSPDSALVKKEASDFIEAVRIAAKELLAFAVEKYNELRKYDPEVIPDHFPKDYMKSEQAVADWWRIQKKILETLENGSYGVKGDQTWGELVDRCLSDVLDELFRPRLGSFFIE